MKFKIERELLFETLQNVSRGLSQKTPMPVLTGVKVLVNEDKIIFITTNKEVAVKIELEKNEKVDFRGKKKLFGEKPMVLIFKGI